MEVDVQPSPTRLFVDEHSNVHYIRDTRTKAERRKVREACRLREQTEKGRAAAEGLRQAQDAAERRRAKAEAAEEAARVSRAARSVPIQQQATRCEATRADDIDIITIDTITFNGDGTDEAQDTDDADSSGCLHTLRNAPLWMFACLYVVTYCSGGGGVYYWILVAVIVLAMVAEMWEDDGVGPGDLEPRTSSHASDWASRKGMAPHTMPCLRTGQTGRARLRLRTCTILVLTCKTAMPSGTV